MRGHTTPTANPTTAMTPTFDVNARSSLGAGMLTARGASFLPNTDGTPVITTTRRSEESVPRARPSMPRDGVEQRAHDGRGDGVRRVDAGSSRVIDARPVERVPRADIDGHVARGSRRDKRENGLLEALRC